MSTTTTRNCSVWSCDNTQVDTGSAGTLTACHRSFARDADLAAVLDGTAAAESVTLTGDGRQANTSEWHSGPEGEWVFVERWTAAGRVFHGWVDSVSRKLLQAG